MQLRPAKDEDIPAMAEIYVDNWKTAYAGILPDTYLESMTIDSAIQKWMKYLREEDQWILVAMENDGEVAGFISCKTFGEMEGCLELYSLHVERARQGKGIGRELIWAAGRYAREAGYGKMAVSVVKGNERAEKLYRKMGAVHHADYLDQFEGTSAESVLLLWEELTLFI